MIKPTDGDRCHTVLASGKGKLAFREENDFPVWKEAVKRKLVDVLGLDVIAENACPVKTDVEETVETDAYKRIRFTYESEKDNLVPAYLLIPKQEKKSYPLAIALQGHTTGFHNSVGIKKFDADVDFQPGDCYGLQAVENGFAALCIEQRGMGETLSKRYTGFGFSCSIAAAVAIHLGRSLIGERVWDVIRGIDAMETLAFPEIDLSKIMIFGHSGGGTASYYAACCEERIRYVVPSCSFCSYRSSILTIEHCTCNYLPGAAHWFDMGDLACLIAPRRLTIPAGEKDDIFPVEGVKEVYRTAEKIYAVAGVPDHCRLVVTPEGHRWCSDLIWRTIRDDVARMGW